MKILLLALILATASYARGGFGFGGGVRGGFGGRPGFGGGFRGGGSMHGGYRPGPIGHPGYRVGISAGYRYGTGRYYGRYYGGFGYSYYPGYVPYYGLGYYSDFGYPYYGGPAYGAGYSAAPNVVVVSPPPQQTSPSVIIYQSRGWSDIPPREQSEPEEQSTRTEPSTDREYRSSVYLIALNDGSIRAAEAYSVEGNTLHYTTRQHEQKQVPLNQVDRQFTYQLNRERRVEFRLP